MIYQYNQRIPFTASDQYSKLTLSGCIDLFQDAANYHTNDVVSPEYLATSGRVWILNYWHIFFDQPCHYNDEVHISTWSAGADRMFAHRFYTVDNAQGETAIRALSYWFLMDRKRMRPVRIKDEDLQWYESSPPLDWPTENRKIDLPEDMVSQESVKICRYMIDGNGHVNNAWYVRVASEYFPVDITVRELRVEYRTAARFGNTFYPTVCQLDDRIYVALCDEAGKPYAIVEAIF